MSAVVAATIPNPVEAVANGIGTVVGRGAGAVGSSIIDAVGGAIARGLAGAAGKVADGVLGFLASSSGPSFDQGWWAGPRAQSLVRSVALLAATLMIAFLLLALIQGILAGEPGAMLRAALVEVPVSVAGTVVLVAVTQVLLSITDGASAMVLQGAPADLGRFLGGFGLVGSVVTNGLLGAVLVVVFLIGALLVWVELLVRASLIYLLVAFAPLTLAARVWPAARGVFRKLCELGVALIVSKFAIALALGLGAAALAGGGPSQGAAANEAGMAVGSLLAGSALMLMAAFSPFVVLRLLPVLEGAAVAQGISRSPARAAQTAMQGAYYADGLKKMAGGGAKGGGSGSSARPPEGGAGSGPGPRPGQRPSPGGGGSGAGGAGRSSKGGGGGGAGPGRGGPGRAGGVAPAVSARASVAQSPRPVASSAGPTGARATPAGAGAAVAIPVGVATSVAGRARLGAERSASAAAGSGEAGSPRST